MTQHRPLPLRFEIDQDGLRLFAHLEATNEPLAIDREGVAAGLAACGFGDWYRLDAAIAQLCDAAASGQPVQALAVAERRDGCCLVEVADDAMTAWLSVHPAAGGAAVTREMVEAALAEQGVVAGRDEATISRAIAEARGERLVIARGRLPEAGRPVAFRSLLPEMRRRGPRMNEHGVVDYRELGTLVVVHAGDPLMRRIPATPGVDGETVRGTPLPATPGADHGFASTLTGAAPGPGDPNLLVASISGQPIQLPDGVTVEPTVTLPEVDLSSGNVDFDGTVRVLGDVAAGMRIRASGDVFIGGTVEAADIEAGGNISVSAGAIGRVDTRGGGQRARLVAQGAVSVRFCENAVIEAGTEVLVAELALHSELTALQRIVIGKPGGKGQLIGGRARAGELLQASVLGSVAAIRTKVQVGFHPGIHAEVAQLRNSLETLAARIEDLQKILALPEMPERLDRSGLREKAHHSLEASLAEQAQMSQALAELEATLQFIESAQVIVGQTLHPSIEVQIGSAIWSSFDTLARGSLRLVEGEIVWMPG